MPKSIKDFFKKKPAPGSTTAGRKRKQADAGTAGAAAAAAPEEAASPAKRRRLASEAGADAPGSAADPAPAPAALPYTPGQPLSWDALTADLDPSWREVFNAEFKKPYFKQLQTQLSADAAANTVYPPRHLLWNAFNRCTLDKVRVVIIGQDPYHQPGQAMGLCFSVPPGVAVPSSLRNIYKELGTDSVPFTKPSHGNLEHWADQGVLLLNASFTVRANQANSHKAYGWLKFTDAVVAALNKHKTNCVFVLWGKFAQKKGESINTGVHHVIKGVHPSGLSASRGFYGSKPFSKVNAFLTKTGQTPIDWQIPAAE